MSSRPSPDLVSPDDVRNKQFSTVKRGYNTAEVEDFLNQVIDTLEEMGTRLRSLSRKPPKAEQAAAPATGAGGVALHDPDGAAQRLLAAAQRTADALVHDAETQATSRTSEADLYAERVRRDAEDHVATLSADAEAQAEVIRGAAAAEARSMAEELRASLVDEVTDLESTREALERDREVLASHLDSERARLRDVVDRLSVALADADSLTVADPPELSGASLADVDLADTSMLDDVVPADDPIADADPFLADDIAESPDDAMFVEESVEAGLPPLDDLIDFGAEDTADHGEDIGDDHDDALFGDVADEPFAVDLDDDEPLFVDDPVDDLGAGSDEDSIFGTPVEPIDDSIGSADSLFADEASDEVERFDPLGSEALFDDDPDPIQSVLGDDPDPSQSILDGDEASSIFDIERDRVSSEPVGTAPLVDADDQPAADGDSFLDELRSTDDEDGLGPVDDDTDAALSAFFDQDDEEDERWRRRFGNR